MPIKCIRKGYSFIFVVVLATFSTSCAMPIQNAANAAEATPVFITSTATAFQSATAQIGNMNTPTAIPPTPTSTLDAVYDLSVTLSVTAGPVFVATAIPNESDYPYENSVVTMQINPIDDPMGARISYLNLDDLNNNGVANSDIEVLVGGKLDFITIKPANNAFYFFTGKNNVDIAFCREHFPLSGFNRDDYDNQGLQFEKSKAFCVLTNQGRVAVIEYKSDSKKYTSDGSFVFSMIVKVSK
jgi:hypothetical protein